MNFSALAIETIKNPAQAARRVLALQLARDAVLLAFALSVVLSVLLFVLPDAIMGQSTQPMLFAFSPMTFGSLAAALQLSFAAGVLLAGRWLGGVGSFWPVFGLLIWVRLVNILVQAFGFMLFFISAPISVMFNLAAGVYGIYVLVHFVNEGLGLGSLSKSFGVLVMAAIGALLCMIVLMGLFAPNLMETAHV